MAQAVEPTGGRPRWALVRNADAQVPERQGRLAAKSQRLAVWRRDSIRKVHPSQIQSTGELVGGNTSSQNRQFRTQCELGPFSRVSVEELIHGRRMRPAMRRTPG